MTSGLEPAGGGLGRLAVSIASQGLSSVTNLGLTVLLVAVAAPAELGRWVAVTAVYLLALTLLRSTVTEPMVAAAAATQAEQPAADGPRAAALWIGTARARRVLGAFATLATVGVGATVGPGVGGTALMAVVMIPLLAQDASRYLAWARSRPTVVLGLDALWLVVSVVALLAAVLLAGRLDPTAVVASWAAGGVVGAVAGWWLLGRDLALGSSDPTLDPDPGSGSGHESGPDAGFRRLALSQGLFACAFNALPVVVAVAVSAPAAGAVRTLLLPFAPVLSVMAGVRVVTLPMMARARSDGASAAVGESADRVVRRVLAVAIVVAAVGAGAALTVISLLPDERLGAAMAEVRPHLSWGAVLCVQYVAAQFLADGLAVTGRDPRVVARRLTTLGLEWTGLLVGALLGGIAGLAVGWSIGLAAAVILWLTPWLRSGPLRASMTPFNEVGAA